MQAGNPHISIVMPTRNRAHLLEGGVRSALQQSFRQTELIVVDDGSTDETPRLLARLARVDARIRVVRLELPVGASRARNRGVAEASAPWIAFLDDDDRWCSTKLERQMQVAETDPEIGLVYCPYVYVGLDGRQRVLGAYDPEEPPGARRMIFRRCFIVTPAVLVRRAVFEAVGGFDPDLPQVEDWDLWIRITLSTRLGFVPEPLVRVYQTPGSISSRTGPLITASRILIHKLAGNEEIGRRERANVIYSLGHEMIKQGAETEGRRLLVRSLAMHPWPLQRFGMVAAAFLGKKWHGRALGLSFFARELAWRRSYRKRGGAQAGRSEGGERAI